MIRNVLLDTGPLVALIDRRDRLHRWVREQFGRVVPPLLTCQGVITEACYLTPRTGRPAFEPLSLIQAGVVQVLFDLRDNVDDVTSLMERYSNVPMSLADACLVRMSELIHDCTVLTLDDDFRIYRRNGRQKIPVLLPPSL